MVLQLKPLFMGEAESLPIDGEIDLSAVEIGGLHPLQQPVGVRGEVRLISGVVTLRGTAYFRYDGPCDRCAAPIRREMAIGMDHIPSTMRTTTISCWWKTTSCPLTN